MRDFRLMFAGMVATMAGDLLLTLMLAVWVHKLRAAFGARPMTHQALHVSV